MKVLVCCEYSGIVRSAFEERGHDAVSCDLLPTEIPGKHFLGDVREIINDGWNLMIAHPPCTYLSSSGLHWNKRVPGRAQKTEEALDFVRFILSAPIDKICVENPVGAISSQITKPTQYIQPYNFGHDASKRTGLWLKNLPPLRDTGPFIEPRIVNGLKRWGNQTDSGQNKLPPSKDRWKIRSTFWTGIAKAMAEQWEEK